MSFRAKLLSAFLFVGLLPSLFLGYISSYQSGRALSEQALHQLQSDSLLVQCNF